VTDFGEGIVMEGLHTLHTVDKRAEEIMIKRYGLDRQGDMSLSEVGEIFGVSRERVRQIEQEATVKLRRNKTLKALAEEIRKGEDALEQKTEAIRKGQETTWLNKTLTCEERVEKRREYQREYMIHYHEKRRKQRAILAQREQEQNEAIQISPLTLSQKA